MRERERKTLEKETREVTENQLEKSDYKKVLVRKQKL